MKRLFLFTFLCLALSAQAQKSTSFAGYLFAYFEGGGDKNLQEHLRFAVSEDAQNWYALNDNRPVVGSDSISESGGMVLTPTDKGNLFALDSRDGSLLWYHKISVALVNPVEAWTEKDGTRILASTMDGTLTLLFIPTIR